jgi:2-dehydro-3-deoxyphosphogalactonate aldolase
VLPQKALIAVVGGITPDNMAAYHSAGANGFGLGSALFKPEYALDDIRLRAREFATAWKELA